MRQKFFNLVVNTSGQRLYEITDQTIEWIEKNNFTNGMLNLSIQHTSASLIVQENADPDVQKDLINYFDRLVPMDEKSYIHNSEGKIVLTGVGKSGIIAMKIAATLSSTGTPSFYLHAADATHGDLGMVEKKDVIIGISKSGNSQELKDLIPFLK